MRYIMCVGNFCDEFISFLIKKYRQYHPNSFLCAPKLPWLLFYFLCHKTPSQLIICTCPPILHCYLAPKSLLLHPQVTFPIRPALGIIVPYHMVLNRFFKGVCQFFCCLGTFFTCILKRSK